MLFYYFSDIDSSPECHALKYLRTNMLGTVHTIATSGLSPKRNLPVTLFPEPFAGLELAVYVDMNK